MRVQISGLAKRYDARAVLRGIHLTIASGEFVAIVGASGSGKSTLLRLLAGLETPDAGSILLDGTPLRGLNRDARVMFQDARLLPWRRVIDNVRLGLDHAHDDRGAAALRMVGLPDRDRDWPAILSGGQRQRVALARALASNPRLMLLDEPLASLDALTRIEMQRLIESLWIENDFSAVLVTHDCAEAVALADRVLMLERGGIAMELRVSLPRPRDRGDRQFGALEGQVLNRILGRDNAAAQLDNSETNRMARARSAR
ncbi:MAG: ATP-binding cassette domain-containing protein [Deltaproteobacteria bacterium]|jgi:sulfonate transport system ATP-binding protein|nr:ATP-binding cassette domain-containing protein [Deltaproteobacteria bacterium]